MDDQHLALVKAYHEAEIKRLYASGELPLKEPPPTHYTELPDLPTDNPSYRPWNTYRRLVGQLLADGMKGIVIVIKGDSILGYYPSLRMASWAVAKESPNPGEEILIKKISEYEDDYVLQRLKTPCQNSPTPLAKTA